jgi:hypothetical protein
VITARLDGEDVAPYTLPELGYNVHTSVIEIPPGETVVMEFELSGQPRPGDYELVYRPQPLPNPTRWSSTPAPPAATRSSSSTASSNAAAS